MNSVNDPTAARTPLPLNQASTLDPYIEDLMKKQAPLFLTWIIILLAHIVVSGQEPPPTPVTINFDELPNFSTVTTQYSPRVLFSATNFSGGSGVPFGWDLYAVAYPPQFSNNKAIFGLNHFCNCFSGGFNTFLHFSVPVNNLTFNILNVGSGYNSNPLVTIDVYRNNTYYQTYYTFRIFGQNTLPVYLLNGITQITDIEIRDINNTDPFGLQLPLYYDDFSFTPDMNINITSPRISGSLNGTQNALVGADIILNTSLSPAGRTGGSYSWTLTGPYAVNGATNTSSLSFKAINPGTLTAKVTYLLNGFITTAEVTINAILPTLTSFTATPNAIDQVSRGQICNHPTNNGAQYSLGCFQYQPPNSPDAGVIFVANAQIPAGQYLTDLSQSGVKIKQFISEFGMQVNATPPGQFVFPYRGAGNVECATFRSSQDAVDSGWAVDGPEAQSEWRYPPPRFNLGNSVQVRAFDAPMQPLDYLLSVPLPPQLYTFDSVLIDDRFQTYVYYFVGDPLDPGAFQRPLKLASETVYNYSYYGWKWNGQVVFNSAYPTTFYQLLFSNTPSIVSMGTNAAPTPHSGTTTYGPCPGDSTPVSSNQIDGSRCFVYQQYWDFLNRAPDGGGWRFWRSQIASCLFDRACIASKRNQVAYAFFGSAEFQQSDPAMANPPGSPNFDPAIYNPAFVRHCYENFLRRNPDSGGLAFWVGVLNSAGDYLGVVGAFSSFPEYRNRNFHTCPST